MAKIGLENRGASVQLITNLSASEEGVKSNYNEVRHLPCEILGVRHSPSG